MDKVASADSDRNANSFRSTSVKRRYPFWLAVAAVVAGSGGVAVATAGPADQPQVDINSVNAWLPSVQRQFIGRTSALVREPAAATGAVVPVRMSSGVTVLRRPG